MIVEMSALLTNAPQMLSNAMVEFDGVRFCLYAFDGAPMHS